MSDDTLVESVNCDQWERGYNRWRTETGALIETEDGDLWIPPGDVTEKSAPDLYFTLELTCRKDLDGGIWGE